MGQTRRKVGLFCVVPVVALGAATISPDTGYSATPSQTCVQLSPALMDRIVIAQAAIARPKPIEGERDPEVFRPINEKDLKLLIEALTPTKLEERDGKRIAAFRRRSPMPAERMAVLMQDITAILARTHLDESLGRLAGMPDPDKEALGWGQGMIKALEFCMQGRYEEFGGNPAFQESVTLVLQNREILEEVVLGNIIPDVVPEDPPHGPDIP